MKCKLKTGYAGIQVAIIEMGKKYAGILIREEKVKIGWLSCRVRIRDSVLKCYKRLEYGHIAAECKIPDRFGVCNRCGVNHHKTGSTTVEAIYAACKDSGYNGIEQILGSKFCRSYRKNSRESEKECSIRRPADQFANE